MDTKIIGDSHPSSAVNLSVCSSQVQSLYPLTSEYREQVHALWAATADNPGPRRLRQRGFRYLVSLYYEMPKRADLAGMPMSVEFKDLSYFCRYVGPRPAATHSLHRLDNELGYRVGNVEWADKRTQAEVRRTTQHHLYLGRHLSDRQLAEVLAKKGHKITPEAVKKQRQRLATSVARSEITKTIFEKIGIPYASSTDPVETWDFPAAFHERLTKLYPNYRGSHESRIHFFVRWLHEQIHEMQKTSENPLTPPSQQSELATLVQAHRRELQQVQACLRNLHQKKTAMLIAEASAPFAADQSVPAYQVSPQSSAASVAVSAIAISLPSPERLAALQKRKLEQQQRRDHAVFLVGLMRLHGVKHDLATAEIPAEIPDGMYARYINYSYFSVMPLGKAAMKDMLIEYHQRGIPMPGADIPDDLDLPFDINEPSP